jgi:predicted lipoprotein with Yx(FWY)xxD motif
VNGTSESVLTNAQGRTLYYWTSYAPPSIVCSGGCASACPPLFLSGSSTPTSAASLPGKLAIVADASGNQVEYNGHPLYTYSGDTGHGKTSGEGVGGVWLVVTLSLTQRFVLGCVAHTTCTRPEVRMGCRPPAHPGSPTSREHVLPPIGMRHIVVQMTVLGIALQAPPVS